MTVPPTSPRLPSPPPVPEIQFGPKSPGMVEGANEQENMIEKSILEANSARRIHPGTKAAEMATGPPLVPLGQVRATTLRGSSSELTTEQLDSPFQLQEHLKALHYSQTRPSASHEVPISRESAQLIASPPPGVDRALWLYELCRFLISKCNDLIVGFLFDSPPCSAQSCPEMRASEWQFLCAVHEAPKSCCAIDYCCHTLDWAANTVTSQKIFPSRLSLGAGDGNEDNNAGVKHLTNIFRRLHRIFAHAWFQHREVFWRIEGETGLYVLFKTVCDTYNLLPAENFKLPPEAEGLDREEMKQQPRQIMKQENRTHSQEGVEDESYKSIGRTNTRRHIRSSPSTGSSVMTVMEADEEELKSMAGRLNRLVIKEEEKDSSDATTPHPLNTPKYDAPSNSESEAMQNADNEGEEPFETEAESKPEEVMAKTSIEPLKSEAPASPPKEEPLEKEAEEVEENTADASTGAKEMPVTEPDTDEQTPSSPKKDSSAQKDLSAKVEEEDTNSKEEAR